MIKHIPQFEKSNLLVIGDLMLDRYWSGDVERISPEAPVPIVHVNNNHEKVGGAGNVAINLSKLGARAFLIGAIGNDDAGKKLQHCINHTLVNEDLLSYDNFSTVTKLRVLSNHQQILRLDFEEKQQVSQTDVLAKAKPYFSQVSTLILSDYAKGMLHSPQDLIKEAKAHNLAIIVDPKGDDYSRYQGATVLTPNKHEFERIVGSCNSMEELKTNGFQLLEQLNLHYLLITLGANGMYMLSREGKHEHIHAKEQEVYDVTGAGDTVVAALGAAFAAGIDAFEAAQFANIAASIVVKKLGASAVTLTEIAKAMKKHDHFAGIVTQEELLPFIANARTYGQKIIMTNGCFDVLHAGHIAYLAEAKKLGGKLVVAVNTDESIKKLKGPTRPLNTLLHRMSVLAALEYVDWVVPFSEETPENLLRELKPDILVKGGDYDVNKIIGADIVYSYGGQVRTLVFEEGLSSTALIDSLA